MIIKMKQMGATLVEVIVGGAILAGIAVVVMGLMQKQNRMVKTFDASNEASDMALRVTNLMANKESCEANLVGMIPTPSGVIQPDAIWGVNGNVSATNNSGRIDGSLCRSRDPISKVCNTPVVTITPAGNPQNGTVIQSIQLVRPATVNNQGLGVAQIRLELRKESTTSPRQTVGGNTTFRLIPVTVRLCQERLVYTPLINGAFINALDAEDYLLELCRAMGGPSTNPYILPASMTVIGQSTSNGNVTARQWVARCFHSCATNGVGIRVRTCY